MSERYQCQCRKKGYGPIRIHVMANQNVSSAPASVDPLPVDICTRKKVKRELSMLTHLSHARELKEIEEQKILQEKELKESRENNKLLEKELEESKEMLEESKKKLKSTEYAKSMSGSAITDS
jgi:hypothetical protein